MDAHPTDSLPYRDAVARQFPGADLTGFRRLGEGGVFLVYETDGGWVWRFPKRPESDGCLDVETALLPALAPALSLRAPHYEAISAPCMQPRFVGYHKIEGVPFTHERLAACASDRPLRQLASFLSELHHFPREQAEAAGVPVVTPDERRAQWSQCEGQLRRHVWPLLDARQRAWAEHVMAGLLQDEAMACYTPALHHGDLWAEHILYDPRQDELTGVIDFESATVGDPAGDWVALWLDHGEETIGRLLALYEGPKDAELQYRITQLARLVPLNELLCGVLYQDKASWEAGWSHLSGASGESWAVP